MPQQVASSVENNFTKGLVTEFTGLNFPENACTDCDNCEFTLIGDVTRRLGFDIENNGFISSGIDRTGKAINTYKWNNAGGDGNTQILVLQVGATLYFYESSAATDASPLSARSIPSLVSVSEFTALNGTFSEERECQFSDGNGYLFVYHPDCDPFYCTYSSGTIAGNAIQLRIRDFTGVVDGLEDNDRPSSLSNAHNYNLQNQGWITGSPWLLTSTSSVLLTAGSHAFTVASGVTGPTGGQVVEAIAYQVFGGSQILLGWGVGTVTSYAGSTLTVNFSGVAPPGVAAGPYVYWTIAPRGLGYINDWFADEGNYPSNADQWWRFKNASGVFDPATTQPNISLSLGAAPKGHFLLSAFLQDRTIVSGVDSLTTISTTARPSNGCWFQGRVWYTGVNASQAASGTALNTTWTENIYFSQVVQKPDDFGKCYQVNDPTSEELFDILPTDGGVIVIQGSGPIYRLFPIQNGLLVFAANGIWFITGSQGIGFSATDYTVTKLSSVEGLSSTSFVDVEGLPYFWNEDGIYAVEPQQGGGLAVKSKTYSTIDTLYHEIPLSSKKYARGAYDPINYTIKWIYRDVDAEDTTETYTFNKILNYNTANQAFFPYTIDDTSAAICSVNFINSPGGSSAPPSSFKYFFTYGGLSSFADEHDDNFEDWASVSAVSFDSYFITGYRIRGQAIRKFQVQYVQVFSRSEGEDLSYKIQGQWDYATSGNTGRWSSLQRVDIPGSDYNVVFKRHKIRGSGYALQIKVLSSPGMPFDVIGWATIDTINAGS